MPKSASVAVRVQTLAPLVPSPKRTANMLSIPMLASNAARAQATALLKLPNLNNRIVHFMEKTANERSFSFF